MTARLVLLGAKPWHQPIYDVLKHKGHALLAVDCATHPLIDTMCDRWAIVEAGWPADGANALFTDISAFEPDGFLCLDWDALGYYQALCHTFKKPCFLPTEGPLTALGLITKLGQANLNTVWTKPITSPDELKAMLLKHRQKRFLLKPIETMALDQGVLIDSQSDGDRAYLEALQFSPSEQIMAQLWSQGQIVSIDFLWHDGKVLVGGWLESVLDKQAMTVPYLVPNGYQTLRDEPDHFEATLTTLLTEAAHALQLSNGVFQTQCLLSPNHELKLGAIWPCPSSYGLSTHIIPAQQNGTSWLKLAVAMATQQPITLPILAPRTGVIGSRYWMPMPGYLTDMHGLDVVSEKPGVLSAYVFAQPNTMLTVARRPEERLGLVMAEANTLDVLTQRLDDAEAAMTWTQQSRSPVQAQHS